MFHGQGFFCFFGFFPHEFMMHGIFDLEFNRVKDSAIPYSEFFVVAIFN